MKAVSILLARCSLVASLMLAGNCPLAWTQSNSCSATPAYSPDFSQNQACLSLNGDYAGLPSFTSPATPQPSVSTVLRLTKNQEGWATSAWYQTPQPVANGFSTTFAFQLGSTTSVNADGIAFVIQNSALTALGPSGGSIGFGGSTAGSNLQLGIPNSVAIEFNTFQNDGIDPSNNDVSIQSCGKGPNSVDPACRLGYNDLTGKVNLTDGNVHVASVTYMPSMLSNCGPSGAQTCSTLDVVVDGIDLFPGGVLFDLSAIGLSGVNAFVGFTAGTGAGNDDQDILSWTFTPQSQSLSGTVSPGQTSPTGFDFNGGFVEGSPASGFEFTAQETDTNLIEQMVVTSIPLSQKACNALVQANPKFNTAQCFVYQNGAGQGQDSSVLFEVTCPPNGSCGSNENPFDAELGANFNFDCSENTPLLCGLPPLPFSFGFPNLTSADGLPEVGLLKGEGPDPLHPCTPNSDGKTPLFQSNQIKAFGLGDTSGGAKAGSGGTMSCWALTYQTQNETPGITIAQPVDGHTYAQGQSDGTTVANYSCSAVNAGNGSPVGPYLSVASCGATDGAGKNIANGTQFDTATPGPHTFTVQVQDSATNTNQQTVNYTVASAPAFTTSTPGATIPVGSFSSVTIAATGSPIPALTETGALPPGVTFVDNKNGTGTLSGTPTAGGIYPIKFVAQNGYASPATLVFTLTVAATVPPSGLKCNGVYNGVFKGSIIVSPGQTCEFIGGGVTGKIVEFGGQLLLSNAFVGDDVHDYGGMLSIGPSVTVKGDVEVEAVFSQRLQSQICGATILGDLEVEGDRAAMFIGSGTSACPGNFVSRNLIVHDNSGTTQIFSNHVNGVLQCQGNAAITGGGNSVQKKLGQCAAF